MSSAKGWILLSHRHRQFNVIEEADILDVLPSEIRDGPRHPVRIENTEAIKDMPRTDWDALQREQAAQVEATRLIELRNEGYGIIYFGRTLLPLAMDLGFRVEKWARSKVFQYHEHKRTWCWPGRPPGQTGPKAILDHNLPSRPSKASGDVIVRVSVSPRISAEDTHAAVPAALGEVDVHLGARCGPDALCTPDELESVVQRFDEALRLIRERYPQSSTIHVFMAGPVSLAFRMGCIINHTVHPRIQTYQFLQTAAPERYQKALMLGQLASAPVKLKIQFLAAEPKHLALTHPLRIGEELRELQDQLRQGEHRDKFAELPETRFAVRAKDIQTYVRRDRAHILHFSGHGEEGGYLLLEDPAGGPKRVHPASMRLLFELWNDEERIRCAVFNACHSDVLAMELVRSPAVVPCAVGTRRRVSDEAAIAFATAFYGALADGEALGKAFRAGCVQVSIASRAEQDVFTLHVADESLRDKPLFEV